MIRRLIHRLLGSDSGAVAPTVALALFALIAVAGIAFDYARLAAMDTELQDAADQAALAAATQLDGATGAQTRATTAANSLITNSTKLANDDNASGRTVTIASITFYSAYTNAGANTLATGDADSNFVKVQVSDRTANYALTPIVAAFSGTLNAKAVAGVGSSICGVVPFFICNPEEPAGNTNVDLSPSGVDPGVGIVMAQGGAQWGPGNFGFLDQAGVGADGVADALASDGLYANCSPTDKVITETGNILNAVRDSLNMRMDFKPGNAAACKHPPCSPSTNATKDVVLTNGATDCAWAQNPATAAEMASGTPPRYFPNAPAAPAAELPAGVTPQIMGYPRDYCHYFLTTGPSGTYSQCPLGRVGTGDWDRAAYFRSNHPGVDWVADPDLGPKVTRYQTYLWEAADPATRLPLSGKGGNGAFTAFGQPQNRCLAPGVAPDPSGSDRRRITAAVVNCRAVDASTGLNGKKKLPVAGFIDVFLVQPSLDRTKCSGCTVSYNGVTYNPQYASRNDIYVEVIGASGTAEGGALPQITRRDVPRLIE